MNRCQEIFGHETAGSVATFWPGIGEHEVKRRDRIRGQEPLHNVGNFQAQDAGVSKASAPNFLTGSANPSGQAFDSKKIAPRIFLGDRHEKQTVATTQIDFERRNPAVNRSEIERLETIRRDEFRRRCWIC